VVQGRSEAEKRLDAIRSSKGAYPDDPRALIRQEPAIIYFARQRSWETLGQLVIALKKDSNALSATVPFTGDTAMHIAAEVGSKECVDVLVAGGLSPNVQNPISGRVPLQSAAYNRQPAATEHLLKLGAVVNETDRSGNTALHIALMDSTPTSDTEQVVRILLSAGADRTLKNKQDLSPLQLAQSQPRMAALMNQIAPVVAAASSGAPIIASASPPPGGGSAAPVAGNPPGNAQPAGTPLGTQSFGGIRIDIMGVKRQSGNIVFECDVIAMDEDRMFQVDAKESIMYDQAGSNYEGSSATLGTRTGRAVQLQLLKTIPVRMTVAMTVGASPVLLVKRLDLRVWSNVSGAHVQYRDLPVGN
jgi:hypothetical protein